MAKDAQTGFTTLPHCNETVWEPDFSKNHAKDPLCLAFGFHVRFVTALLQRTIHGVPT